MGAGHLFYGRGMQNTHFLVRKDALANTQLQTVEMPDLAEGQIRLQIDHFALTSNNITYAAMGDAMQYWRFFPVQGDAQTDTQWGQIPVWGFATVTESLHPMIPAGERIYGYFPMARWVDLTPGTISPAYFYDLAPHRAELHPVYNQYMRCSADPFYTSDTEALQALLRPLFITSWLIDDFLADNNFFGAADHPTQRGVVLISSASSKTAYGTAFQLARRDGIDTIGLTSPGNVAFCESLGCYHRVLTYDQLDQIPATTPGIYVDFAGNVDLRMAIHTRFTELKYSSSIGATHVEHMGGAKGVPGPKVTLFFAPAQIKKRSAEWGSQGLAQRLVHSWRNFSAEVSQPAHPWLTVEHHRGGDAVQAAYHLVLGGKGDPRVGHMVSLN